MMDRSKVESNESLGRCCFDSSDAERKNPRTRFIRTSFVKGEMSVDRLSWADIHRLNVLHAEEGSRRQPPRTFQGWYEFRANKVRSVGWEVSPDETDENPWHAKIVPLDSMDEADAFTQQCEKIAAAASWRPRPMLPAIEEFLEEVSEGFN